MQVTSSNMRSQQQNGCMPTQLHLFISKPIKALRKARDLYVKKLKQCGAKLSCCGSICCAASAVPHHSCLQRSFSKLKLKQRDRIRVKGGSKQPSSSAPAGQSLEPEAAAADQVGIRRYGSNGLRRSNSYGLGYLGRIDEDKPYCFEEDFVQFRSRSVGIAMMTNLGLFDL